MHALLSIPTTAIAGWRSRTRERGPAPATTAADDRSLLSRRVAGQTGSILLLVGGLITLISAYLPFTAPADRRIDALIGGVAAVSGAVAWFLPWERWPRSTGLWAITVVCALIALHNQVGGAPSGFSSYYVICFAWMGLTQPRGTALRFAPVLAVTYLTPLWVSGNLGWSSVAAFVYDAPVSVLVGETIAWVASHLRKLTRSLERSEERFRLLVERVPAAIYIEHGGESGHWRYVSPRIVQVVGGEIEPRAGRAFDWTGVIHPDDRAHVIAERRQCHDTATGWRQEYRCVRPDGNVIWARDEAAPVDLSADGERYWQGVIIDITERKLLEERMAFQALHDTLTGVGNRALLVERLTHALELAEQPVALLFIDLDDFKGVNDRLGHEAGDQYLRAVARRLQAAVREHDTVARFGGDEFTVLLESPQSAAIAHAVAERIRRSLAKPLRIGGELLAGSASIGVAVVQPGAGLAADDVLLAADRAMYQAKQQGKGRIVLAPLPDDTALTA